MRAARRSQPGRTRGLTLLVMLLLVALLAGCAPIGKAHRAATPTATATATPPPTTPDSLPRPLAPPPAISAQIAYLLDPTTGVVYFARNADTQAPMASTTKIMTAMVAILYGKLDQRITVGPDLSALDGTGASVAGLRVGETLTLRELLYALLLPSGDDAALVIADGVAGSQERFVGLMNLQAQLMGMYHTHYANAHGLDAPDHFTTARDLATLTLAALRSPTFAKVVSTAEYVLPATGDHQSYDWKNTNLLLSTMRYPGADGVKTGFTGNAGGCLVFSASRPNERLLGVVLNEPYGQDDSTRFADAASLLTWGFSVEAEPTRS